MCYQKSQRVVIIITSPNFPKLCMFKATVVFVFAGHRLVCGAFLVQQPGWNPETESTKPGFKSFWHSFSRRFVSLPLTASVCLCVCLVFSVVHVFVRVCMPLFVCVCWTECWGLFACVLCVHLLLCAWVAYVNICRCGSVIAFVCVCVCERGACVPCVCVSEKIR